MKNLLSITRYIVGILFIFSGLIKANDPMGLSYKMQEFFEVWGIHFLNDYSLVLSILMIAFEIIAGVAVIIGWRFILFSWLLLLLIIFFTFLTAYAVFSGNIRECGCFGDCFKLQAMESFIKDLVLTILIVFLFVNRKKIVSQVSDRAGLICMSLATVLSFGLQGYVLKHLPLLDCLPYKKGVNILEKRKIPVGAIPDSTVINFIYATKGKEVEFDADHFPPDFSDSAYKFVRRYDKVIRKGNAEPPIKDFVLINEANVDSTEAILSQPGKMVIVFVKQWQSHWKEDLQKLSSAARVKKITMLISSATADQVRADVEVPVMKSDLVAIKTAARVDPTIYFLVDGTIREKWALSDLDKAIDYLNRQ